MISKLPKWVWGGGAVLAFSSGMINAIAMLGFSHHAATHLTGLFSHFSIALHASDASLMKLTGSVILSFFLGSILSGVILRDHHLKMGRRYGFALFLESMLLFASAYGFYQGSVWGEYCASMAAGLQNALASTYSGTIIRTTHMTGIVTDLGVLVGHAIRGIQIDLKRTYLFLVLIGSFLFGGLMGAVFFSRFQALAMLIPAVTIGLSSIFYGMMLHHMRKNQINEPPKSHGG